MKNALIATKECCAGVKAADENGKLLLLICSQGMVVGIALGFIIGENARMSFEDFSAKLAAIDSTITVERESYKGTHSREALIN